MKKRFFVEQNNIHDGYFILTEDEHQHLSRVMRMSVGDEVECFYDGSDIYTCRIDRISKNDSEVSILSSYPCPANPKIQVTLFQALPKLDKLELVTQKICELGAYALVPFTSTYCIAKENSGKIDRLRKIVISSCKQCGRSSLLRVDKTRKFSEMLSMLPEYDIVLFANEKEKDCRLKDILTDKKYRNIAVVVGSEGGFSDDEIDALRHVCQSFTFGERILRTETASIVAVADVMCLMGED